jgi:uncharacterized protein (TIGR02246 family)
MARSLEMTMRFALVSLTAVASLACAGSDSAPADSQVAQAGGVAETATVQRAIDSSLAVFMDAAKRSDAATMAGIFAEDGMAMMPGNKAAVGRPNVEKAMAAMFRVMSLPELTIKTTHLVVSGDYAIETGTYDQTAKPTNGSPTRDVGKYVTVWQRQSDGSWKIARDIMNSDQAP